MAALSLPDFYSSALALPKEPPSAEDWAQGLRSLAREKLTGFALDLARRSVLPLTEGQVQKLEQHHRAGALRVLWLERALIETCSRFEAHGIDYRVLKGAALARNVYPAPRLRHYVDVDLLVPRRQFDSAVDILLGQGSHRVREEPQPGFVARFGKSAEFIRADDVSIDLHCSLTLGRDALRIRTEDLFSAADALQLGPHTLRSLPAAERFLHACYHATVGNEAERLLPYLDVAMTGAAVRPDDGRLAALRERWGAEAVVALALVETWRVLGIQEETPLASWALSRLRESGGGANLHRVVPSASPAAEVFAVLREIQGLRNRATFLRNLLFPSRAYRKERGQSRLGRFLAALRRLGQG